MRLRLYGLVGLLCLGAALGCSKGNAPPDGHVVGGGEERVVKLLKDPVAIQPFTVTDLDGQEITSEALKGKVVLVNFWATWCPPCRQEIPDLIRLQDKYRDHLVVIGISEDEAPVEVVRAFAAEHKINYFVGMTTPQIGKTFRGVSALPTTFVLDREGKVVQRHVGLLDPVDTELETQVLANLAQDIRVERVEDPARVRLANAAQATKIPGLDLSGMSPARRTAAVQALNAEDCTCGCGLTLAECRIDDPSCDVSLPLARALVERLAKTQPQ